ncbi:helix-turn-helix transcriptional regulator [Stackebrandtia nassauensis]|uniref:Putative transcriptional regulator n=1 Tax=Stackebrandtia nassauensis (strain DSM 44728 / CIP 108903 / NRRL B-16338 / NBRC 102104 / LLR-40K-21) TaxID=446470 RepID=D3Q4U4_STANL|nr:winged helix-turn-helix transcriptional regulator [Stackebrandtia nassauensis]ADD42124.1 putative transcriptional regulator [Stackebrandtia nassauensis DSM 44728]
MEYQATRQPTGCATPDGDTRQRVARLLLENGNTTARDLADALGISQVAVRKHLDAMTAEGLVDFQEPDASAPGRGRGRPARTYRLTAAARDSFGHHYDDLATQALRWIYQHGGPAAVAAFAAEQVSRLEERCRTAIDGTEDDPLARAAALAEALSAEGYAATTNVIAGGGQLCQHHCPVSHVAAEFPQLCEAETAVISRLVGHHVQRLATIANGDGVCTTYIPGPARGATTLPIIDKPRQVRTS